MLVLIFWGNIPCVYFLGVYVIKSRSSLLCDCSVHVSDGFPYICIIYCRETCQLQLPSPVPYHPHQTLYIYIIMLSDLCVHPPSSVDRRHFDGRHRLGGTSRLLLRFELIQGHREILVHVTVDLLQHFLW